MVSPRPASSFARSLVRPSPILHTVAEFGHLHGPTRSELFKVLVAFVALVCVVLIQKFPRAGASRKS
eukprot:9021577-Lingulodinium_polyedra.AAC.1